MSVTQRKIVPKPKALNCPSCGSQIELRAMGTAASIACGYCATTIDATNPQLQIIQKFDARFAIQPIIPLGSRGTLKGTVWEIIGFQQRGITVDGANYFWREYVLFNPFKGFRYLSEYNYHWSFVTPMPSLPAMGSNVGRPTAQWGNNTFDHFQTAEAVTYFVVGEFPWQVKVGEAVSTSDYVAPPKMLSSETTENEVTWSIGEYVAPQEIWTAFKLPNTAPVPVGVFANQPSPGAAPVGKQPPGRPWLLFLAMAGLLFAMMIGFAAMARQEQVFKDTFVFNPAATGEKSLVTKSFELKGGKGNVQIDIDTGLDNSWAYFSMALINEQTGDAVDFGREVGYYHGVDEGESWSEGDRHDDVIIPGVPGGKYYLRIEPDTDPPTPGASAINTRSVTYTVTVTRDVPFYFRYILGIFLLFIPVIFMGRKSFGGSNFESQRWAESDHGTVPGMPPQSDDDDEE